MGDNTAIARQWFREVWVEGGEVTIDELMAPDAMGWMEGRVVKSPQDFKNARRGLLSIFPDLSITVDDVIEQGNKVAVRWSVEIVSAAALKGTEQRTSE
jgi:ketosteroid isomerase-like protein